MALQDGLLSFAIKETIFLSSDRAGIGELQELELVPDVEVLENDSYISITGCLQLFGKYEPIRDAAETEGGGAETLVQAMTFSPFRPEGTEGPYYGWEEQIGHRVPLNITIPLERIAEIGDIYAIVDSFDYKLESPHQLLIEAELKIVGIVLSDQPTQSSANPNPYEQPEAAHEEEAWEFAHVASNQTEGVPELTSLEDIEQKLAQLEQQLELQGEPVAYESGAVEPVSYESGTYESGVEQPVSYESETYGSESYESESYESESYESGGYAAEESTSLYDAPAMEVAARDYYPDQHFGEVTEPDEAQLASYPEERYADAPLSWEADQPAIESAAYASPVYGTQVTNADQTEQWVDVPVQREEQEEATLAIHDHHEPDFTPVVTDETQEAEAELEASGQEDVTDVAAEFDASDEVELKIAISGKPSREEAGNVNITSIFSQASRAKQEAMALEAESSASSSSRRGSSANSSPNTLEAMQNLTSFIRNKEERSSQLKMCIIQRDETLELISQRYSLPVSKIVEVNRLASEQLVAGQILYIPQ
ncbi:LysM peptidoglycan-binding domain-containing protein [Brevibacillus choshinensis]|uniref:LysM peptidoglycan-binding domain-containing protein n=1 Tax=Brevibacillus choshinensis TaxID=54911 RepID=A0ABX7FUV3_BRECH|nr:LysM peptidoglycan-binding domain-containing protein [Brevibacillus choshinensis]QRG69387.1 LysM peptidoglycan-binding domain-containing protein [Brevibacillus choshinensis]